MPVIDKIKLCLILFTTFGSQASLKVLLNYTKYNLIRLPITKIQDFC